MNKLNSTTVVASQLVNEKLEELVNRNKLTSLEIRSRALTIALGLTSTIEPNDMTAWYCKAYRTIGEGRYQMCADVARQGNKPKQLFGWLLREEMKRGYK